MPDEIRYERGVPRGEFFAETTAAGTTFYLPPPSSKSLGCAAVATVAAIGFLVAVLATGAGDRDRGLIAMALMYCLAGAMPIIFLARQRGMRRTLEITAEGVRFAGTVGRSRTDWAIEWRDVVTVAIKHEPRGNALIVLAGVGPRRWINTAGLTVPQRDAIVDALSQAHARSGRGNEPA